MTDPDLLGSHLFKDPMTANHTASDSISLSSAINLYVQHIGQGKGKTFTLSVQRAFRYLVKACSSKDLHEYTRADAIKFRDHLVKKGLAGSRQT